MLVVIFLEILGFVVIIWLCSSVSVFGGLVLAYFTVCVVEGVIALSSLIIIVSFVGSDYLSSSSVLKL